MHGGKHAKKAKSIEMRRRIFYVSRLCLQNSMTFLISSATCGEASRALADSEGCKAATVFRNSHRAVRTDVVGSGSGDTMKSVKFTG